MKEVVGERTKDGWRYQFPIAIQLDKGESICVKYNLLHPERIFFIKHGKCLTFFLELLRRAGLLD